MKNMGRRVLWQNINRFLLSLTFKYRMLFYLPFLKAFLALVIIIQVRHIFSRSRSLNSASRKCVKIVFSLSGNFPFKLSTFYSSLIDRFLCQQTHFSVIKKVFDEEKEAKAQKKCQNH